MKLFELLHNVVEGMGQGQFAPAALLEPRRARPVRILPFAGPNVLRHVTKVMVQACGVGSTAPDLWWLMVDADDTIVFVTQGGEMLDERMFSWIRNSPGFDKTAVRRAVRSTRNARYTVWQQDIIAHRASKKKR